MAKIEKTKKEQVQTYATAGVKVFIALSLLLGAVNLAGYIALGATPKLIIAIVGGVVGVWILLKNAE